MQCKPQLLLRKCIFNLYTAKSECKIVCDERRHKHSWHIGGRHCLLKTATVKSATIDMMFINIRGYYTKAIATALIYICSIRKLQYYYIGLHYKMHLWAINLILNCWKKLGSSYKFYKTFYVNNPNHKYVKLYLIEFNIIAYIILLLT